MLVCVCVCARARMCVCLFVCARVCVRPSVRVSAHPPARPPSSLLPCVPPCLRPSVPRLPSSIDSFHFSCASLRRTSSTRWASTARRSSISCRTRPLGLQPTSRPVNRRLGHRRTATKATTKTTPTTRVAQRCQRALLHPMELLLSNWCTEA